MHSIVAHDLEDAEILGRWVSEKFGTELQTGLVVRVANTSTNGAPALDHAKLTAKVRQAGRDALRQAAAKRAMDLAPIIAELRAAGAESLQAIANGLNERTIPAAKGGNWSATQVARVLGRL